MDGNSCTRRSDQTVARDIHRRAEAGQSRESLTPVHTPRAGEIPFERRHSQEHGIAAVSTADGCERAAGTVPEAHSIVSNITRLHPELHVELHSIPRVACCSVKRIVTVPSTALTCGQVPRIAVELAGVVGRSGAIVHGLYNLDGPVCDVREAAERLPRDAQLQHARGGHSRGGGDGGGGVAVRSGWESLPSHSGPRHTQNTRSTNPSLRIVASNTFAVAHLIVPSPAPGGDLDSPEGSLLS
mmetsp:Transcript_41037/g.98505  ORF Transcript_41037/g.98505 Transcript_41037/m.98505 type:complete len:242 (-) Transcript_41037:493-1218(-)